MLKIRQYNKPIFFIFIFIFIFILLLIRHIDFLVGTKFHYHDSLAANIDLYISMDSLVNNHFPPLWSNLMNNGTPLFVNTEILQAFDPVSIIISLIYYKLGLSNILAYSLINIIWLFIFSLGGMLCSRFISKNLWINLITFIILFGGPIGYSIIAQSGGLIHPFRYVPIVIYLFLKFIEKKSYKRAALLGASLVLSEASFQTIFSFFFLVPFLFLYFLFNYFLDRNNVKIKDIKLILLIFIILLIGFLPTIASGIEMLNLFPVARVYLKYGWFFNSFQLFIQPFFPNLIKNWSWHGGAFIGFIPVFLVYFSLAVFLLKMLSLKLNWIKIKLPDFTPLELTWLFVLIIIIPLCVGLFGLEKYVQRNGAFCGVRNFGLLITIIVFISSQLAAVGLKHLTEYTHSFKQFIKILYLSLGIIFIVIYLTLLNFHINMMFFIFIFILLNIVAITILITCFFSNVFHLVYKKVPVCNYFTFIIFLISLICLFLLPSRSIYSPFTFSRFNVSKNFMCVKKHKDIFSNTRQYLADISNHVPFHYFYPILFQENYAVLNPIYRELSSQKYSGFITNPGTPLYFFDTKRYNTLTTSVINEKTLKVIFGVSAPILKVVHFAIKSTSPDESIKLLKDFKKPELLNNIAIIEGDFPKHIQLSSFNALDNSVINPKESIKVKKFTQDNIIIELNTKKEGILVYADNYTDDWKVYVNGKPKNLLVADCTNKAVFVSKGHNIVQFVYRPIMYIISFWIRLIFFICLVCWFFTIICRRNRTEKNISYYPFIEIK